MFLFLLFVALDELAGTTLPFLIMRVFENRVLWRIFGPKTDEVTGGW
jgi:hypothetical protein